MEELGPFPFKAVARAVTHALRCGGQRGVEIEGQVRLQSALHQGLQLSNGALTQAPRPALVGVGGVGEALADHPNARVEGRTNPLLEMLAAGGEDQQQFGKAGHGSSRTSSSKRLISSASGVPPGSRVAT